jgi:hypothetical protein
MSSFTKPYLMDWNGVTVAVVLDSNPYPVIIVNTNDLCFKINHPGYLLVDQVKPGQMAYQSTQIHESELKPLKEAKKEKSHYCVFPNKKKL